MTEVDDVRAADWRLCVAPMMQRTDRHFRYLARLLAPRARLYTEMITSGAVVHGDRSRLLAYDPFEHPLAVQLGGSVASDLAHAARICAEHGFVEVNLNCGCPSERVQAGAFGACLMLQPTHVADCIKAMLDAVPAEVMVSVKTRLGVDDAYSYGYFSDFIGTLAEAGCRVFQVHARKAWLSGLSPAENRELPPLEYQWVYRIKRELRDRIIVLNGGIGDPQAALQHISQVDGVMLGRHAYAEPMRLRDYHALLFGAVTAPETPAALIEAYLPYLERELGRGTELKHITRHLLTLFQGEPGARRWRRDLTLAAARKDAGSEFVHAALRAYRAAPARRAGEFRPVARALTTAAEMPDS